MPGGVGAHRGGYGPGDGPPQNNQYRGGPPPSYQQGRGLAQHSSPSQGFPQGDAPADRQNPYGPGLGYDPAKPSTSTAQRVITNTRMELPAAAYRLEKPNVSSCSSSAVVYK